MNDIKDEKKNEPRGGINVSLAVSLVECHCFNHSFGKIRYWICLNGVSHECHEENPRDIEGNMNNNLIIDLKSINAPKDIMRVVNL